MLIIFIVGVIVVISISLMLLAHSHNKAIEAKAHATEFDKINSIDDPLLRQVAINDWLNKRV